MKWLVRIGFNTEVISSVAIWLRKAQIGTYDNDDKEPCPRGRAQEWGGDYAYYLV